MTKTVKKFVHHVALPSHSNNQRARIPHPSGIAVLISIFIFFQLLIRYSSPLYQDILGYASQIPASEVIRLTNIERKSKGLSELKVNEKLSKAAEKKAADMFVNNYWAHVSPSGTQPWYFINSEGYSYRYAGENLARDFANPESVVKAWIASPTHRDNLLSSKYQEIGVAVVDGTLTGKDTTLVVQMFGTPLSSEVRPSVSKQASITVKASEVFPTVVPIQKPQVNALVTEVGTNTVFNFSKLFGVIILSLLIFVIILDIVFVNHRSLVRWTSKSPAHLIFIIVIMIAVVMVARGQII